MITVVLRTKDRLPFLKRAIQSLLQQTVKNFEVVIINVGGFEEEINGLIPKSAVAFNLIHKKGLNVSQASNLGCKAAIHPWITHLDDDDTLEPTFLEECLSFLKAHPQAKGVATYASKIEEDGLTPVSKIIYPVTPPYISLQGLLKNNQFTNNSFVFSKEIYDAIDGFDPELDMFEDWDFNLRFIAKAPIGLIKKPLANYHFRIHHSSNQRLGSKDNKEELVERFIENHLKKDLARGSLGLGTLLHLQRSLHKEQSLYKSLKNDFNKLFS